ncbi:MAG TPA: ATP-binding cassette domain-containing protein [Edaphobacter sp.]
MSASVLSVKIRHRIGLVPLDLDFALTQPWSVLFGPSGSGKTTLLRAIAGLVRVEQGRIVRGNTALMDTAAGVFIPAHLRPVRSAPQAAWLFPHLTVIENLLYGCGKNSPPQDQFRIAEEMMELFRLGHISERMPRVLSGGERQRVAVARAVVSAVTFTGPEPALLLLDEPFSGLDLALRDELLARLKEWLGQRQIPVLSVTHDVGEAFQLEAEVIRIADGKVVAQGQASAVLAEERRLLVEQLGRGVFKS